jgi:molybdate transport system substrate-binding protein
MSSFVLTASLLFGAACAHAQELIVSAAASLTAAFREIGAAFEKEQSGVSVVFNFAASGPLLQQIDRGAPVDVFASADSETMDLAAAKKLIDPATRSNFASNTLVLIVPPDTKSTPHALPALDTPGIKRIGIGNPSTAPFGRYARDILMRENLWDALKPRFIFGDTVRQVVDYVARAEVDAGFVFKTDAASAKDRIRLAFELSATRPIRYPIAVVAGSRQPPLAQSFLNYVSGPPGQAVLAKYGFGKP